MQRKHVISPEAPPLGGEIILYQSPDGEVRLDVHFDRETVWLTQEQMAELFGRERSVITKHINNVFREGELRRRSVCAKFAHTAADGKTYQVEHYNLDVIISVGYRVKSRRGTQFRIWATRTLRDHLIQGYTLHEKRLREKGLKELEQAVEFLARTLSQHSLVTDEGRAVLEIVQQYTRALVEQAALAWLKTGGGRVTHGSDIAPDLPPAGRADHDGRPDARSGQHELTNSRAAN